MIKSAATRVNGNQGSHPYYKQEVITTTHWKIQSHSENENLDEQADLF